MKKYIGLLILIVAAICIGRFINFVFIQEHDEKIGNLHNHYPHSPEIHDHEPINTWFLVTGKIPEDAITMDSSAGKMIFMELKMEWKEYPLNFSYRYEYTPAKQSDLWHFPCKNPNGCISKTVMISK